MLYVWINDLFWLDESSTQYWVYSTSLFNGLVGRSIVVVVLSKVGQELSRRVIGSTLAGDGLLVRLRSTSIGLIGVVAATGLGLVAFIAGQGWPAMLNSPIPKSPPAVTAVHDAVRVGGSPPSPSTGTLARVSRTGRTVTLSGSGTGTHVAFPRAGGLHGAHAVGGGASSPSPGPTPAPAQSHPVAPEPQAPPAPTGQGNETVPASTPVPSSPSVQPVSSSVHGPDGSYADGGKGRGDSGSSGKSAESHATDGPVGHGHASGYGEGHDAGKSSHGHGYGSAPPPPPESSAESAEEVPGKGSDQETHGNGHAYGKSGKAQH